MEFSIIPEQERKAEWFLLLEGLLKKRKTLQYPENSALITVLNGYRWTDIRSLINHLIEHVDNYKKIFSRVSDLNNQNDPDNLIDAIFTEIEAAVYLVFRGFKNTRYIGAGQQRSFDFSAMSAEKIYDVEVKYRTAKIENGVCELESTPLVTKLRSAYDEAKEQIDKRGHNEHNAILIIVCRAFELEPQFMDHDLHKGKHPIQSFVDSCKIPTVVLPVGYETKDKFGDKAFDRDEFVKFCYPIGYALHLKMLEEFSVNTSIEQQL